MERAHTEQQSSMPSKLEENLQLSRALTRGGISFVFRDLLNGPHYVEGAPPLAEGQKPPNASLYSAAYPSTADGRPQVVNRWPRHMSLTSKDGSLRSLVAYYQAQSLSPWHYVPLSFALPNFALSRSDPAHSQPWLAFVDAHGRVGRGGDARVPTVQCDANLWLLKPTNGSGGEGISIASELHVLEEAMARAKASTQGFIAQKYLERPMLYDGRKFDLRVWACIASDVGSPAGLRVYAYREGYARTSSEAFSLPAIGSANKPADEAARAHERLVHLTNYCMQVQGEACGSHEEGNCVSFGALDAAVPSVHFRSAVLPRLYALVGDAVLASRRELLVGLKEHGGGRGVCAILGYDFMITHDGRPFLIECNANPLLAAQNPWHDQLVNRMVDDYVDLLTGCFFGAQHAAADPIAHPTAHPITPTAEQAGPRPPLDGTEVEEFDGSGFLLLLGRPTEAHPTPMFSLATEGGVVCLERSEDEKEEAAAVEEPPPPPPPLLPSALALAAAEPSQLPLPSALAAGASHGMLRTRLAAGAAAAAIRSEAASAHAKATERRLAAMRYAATHRAAAASSMPPVVGTKLNR